MCEDPEAVVGQSISQLRSSLSLKHAIYRQQVSSSAFGIISIIIIRSDPAVADTRTGSTETPLECWPEPTDNGPVRAGLLQKHNASYRSVRLCYITCNGLKRPCPVPLSREGESARRYCPGQQQSWGFVGHSHSTNTHTYTHASDGQSALTQDAPLTKAVQSVLDSLSIYELLSSLQVATEKEKRENSELFLGKIRYPAERSLFMVCRFMAATSCLPHGLLPSLQSSNP